MPLRSSTPSARCILCLISPPCFSNFQPNKLIGYDLWRHKSCEQLQTKLASFGCLVSQESYSHGKQRQSLPKTQQKKNCEKACDKKYCQETCEKDRKKSAVNNVQKRPHVFLLLYAFNFVLMLELAFIIL
jgi:hypothetical protein